MYHYSSPPQGWSGFEYTTSPPTSPHYAYYSSQYANPHLSPRSPTSKRHGRKASYTATKEPGGWYTGVPGFHEAMPEHVSPRKHENVSASFGDKKKSAQRRHTIPGTMPSSGVGHDRLRPSRSQKRPIFVDVVDDAYDEPRYVYSEPRPSRSGRPPLSTTTPLRESFNQSQRYPYSYPRKPKPNTDTYFYYNQVPNHDDAAAATAETPKRSRARRASTSTQTPPKPKMASKPKSPPKATEADALREGIPQGYSIKNWDPTEAPIILLGSVFDANSLGKWIYDWTVFHHGASTPMADVAGDLWLLLIKLAGKVKRARECLIRIHSQEDREMVEDFLESGARLWSRFKKLLKACEHFMWKAAKRDGGKGTVSMGRNAGCEFVESIFGRDRELENTEKLMNSIRLWNMRFDANCEGILRRP
ncbi:hypothetical protein V8E54_001374 [Elaphomyces granulatus]